MKTKTVPILYHYTTFSSACEIISSRSIRLFRSSSMSDLLEVRYGANLLVETLFEALSSKGLVVKNRRKLATIMLAARDLFGLQDHSIVKESYAIMNVDDRWIQQQSTSKDPDRAREVYLASFTEDPDALMQWRLYGGQGTGVCIGMSFTGTEKLKREGKTPIKIHVNRVKYDRAQMKRNFQKQIEKILISDELWPLANSLFFNATLLKQSDYVHEKEWRLFVWTNALDKSPEMTHDGRRIRPYLNLDFPKGGKESLPIVSVRTGPCSSFDGRHDEDWRKYVETHLPELASSADVFYDSEKEIRS